LRSNRKFKNTYHSGVIIKYESSNINN
jgi:hypothetical protein